CFLNKLIGDGISSILHYGGALLQIFVGINKFHFPTSEVPYILRVEVKSYKIRFRRFCVILRPFRDLPRKTDFEKIGFYSILSGMLNKSFFKFTLGFIFILAVSFFFIIATSYFG
ncbi:hypothetical protein KKG48_01640, partial [Patescibacteria group bacterium]|nr:hypothetical protein [Patescibacteria group bacterium]